MNHVLGWACYLKKATTELLKFWDLWTWIFRFLLLKKITKYIFATISIIKICNSYLGIFREFPNALSLPFLIKNPTLLSAWNCITWSVTKGWVLVQTGQSHLRSLPPPHFTLTAFLSFLFPPTTYPATLPSYIGLVISAPITWLLSIPQLCSVDHCPSCGPMGQGSGKSMAIATAPPLPPSLSHFPHTSINPQLSKLLCHPILVLFAITSQWYTTLFHCPALHFNVHCHGHPISEFPPPVSRMAPTAYPFCLTSTIALVYHLP